MIDGAGGIAASAYAGYQVVGGVASLLFQQLLFNLLADDRLQAGHHVGIGMRPYGRADDVVGIGRMAAPVADGLVGSVLQGHVAAGYRYYGGSQHLHLLHVDVLAFHVCLAHVHHTLHAHQRTDGSRSHAVLSGTGLGNDALLAHATCQQNLADGVVDFVCSGMVQVFPLQVDAATILLREPMGQVEGRGASHIVP